MFTILLIFSQQLPSLFTIQTDDKYVLFLIQEKKAGTKTHDTVSIGCICSVYQLSLKKIIHKINKVTIIKALIKYTILEFIG